MPVFGQKDTDHSGLKASDESAVRSLVQKCVDGWNKGSGNDFAAQFAENADYVVVNGMHQKGRPQIAAAHQQIFDTFYKGTRLWVEIKSVRSLAPDFAVMHSVSRVLKPGESGSSPEPAAIQSWIAVKRDGEWRIEAFHNTPIERNSGPAKRP